jgi:hypothetical protein
LPLYPPAVQLPAEAHDTERTEVAPTAPATCCAVPQVPPASVTTYAWGQGALPGPIRSTARQLANRAPGAAKPGRQAR